MLWEKKQKVLQKWQWEICTAVPLPVHVPTCVPWIQSGWLSAVWAHCSHILHVQVARNGFQDWLCCDFGCADRPQILFLTEGRAVCHPKEVVGLMTSAPATVSVILIQCDCQWTWDWLLQFMLLAPGTCENLCFLAWSEPRSEHYFTSVAPYSDTL